jgi:hypothetical protein
LVQVLAGEFPLEGTSDDLEMALELPKSVGGFEARLSRCAPNRRRGARPENTESENKYQSGRKMWIRQSFFVTLAAGVARQELKTLFCKRCQCSLAEFEGRAFRDCLPWHARLLAPVIRKLTPTFFAKDFEFIKFLGAAVGSQDIQAEVGSFQDANRDKGGLFRRGLHIRVSGRKASALARELFADARRKRQ